VNKTLEYLQSFVVIALLLAGLTGIAYHMFRQDGWIESITGGIWGLTMRSPLMALVVVGGAIALGVMRWRSRKIQRDQGKVATVVFYIIIAAGAYFLGRLAIVGSL
jgi:uncharacterized membrane protein YhaH (DUF805 family)